MRAMNLFSSAAVGFAVIASGSVMAADPLKGADGDSQTVEFTNSDGKSVGKATLTETPNGVLVDATFKDLEPGWHAFHIHEKGKCEKPGFKSAGGHYQPHGNKHGFRTVGGAHAGDLENIYVDDNGDARVQALADRLTLKEGNAALLDDDGAALMVHSGADDYRSQPSGNAGKRVACAEIRKE